MAEQLPWHKARLKALGKTQKEMGQAVGLSPTAISLTLSGQRTLSALEAVMIARFLETDIGTLLEKTGFVDEIPKRKIYPSYTMDTDGALSAFDFTDFKVCAPAAFDGTRDKAIYVDSDAMNPRFRRGDILFTRPCDLRLLREFSGYDILAYIEDGSAVIRRLFLSPDRQHTILTKLADFDLPAPSTIEAFEEIYATKPALPR